MLCVVAGCTVDPVPVVTDRVSTETASVTVTPARPERSGATQSGGVPGTESATDEPLESPVPTRSSTDPLASDSAPANTGTDRGDASTVPEPELTSEPESAPEPTPIPTATAIQAATPAPEPTPAPTAMPLTGADAIANALPFASLQDMPCPEGARAADVRCSSATLPVHPLNPGDGETVELVVAYVDNGDPHGVGPVFFLQGGPGVGSVSGAARFVGASYDLVFIDQRGTGASTPRLDCDEVDALWADDLGGLVDEAQVLAGFEACADRLRGERVDLNAFHTDNAAFDVALIRQLLGIEDWSIWGISYGTRLGLTILRDHADGLRAAILDSVLPFEVDFFGSIPRNGLRSIEALSAACAADTCATDHGDFLDQLGEAARRLDADPLTVSANRSVTGEPFDVVVDGAELLDLTFAQLYSTSRLRQLPRQVARFEFGGIEEMVTAHVSRRDPQSFDLSSALYYTTWCREEVPFYDETFDDQAVARGVELFGAAFDEALSADGVDDVCAAFGVDVGPSINDRPITSQVPTVVFAGAFDPVTPPEWSKQVADQLAETTYVEFADHGHGMTSRCAGEIQLEFLKNPTAALDLACVIEVGPPDFD